MIDILFLPALISALVSFFIAFIGWHLLDLRATKTAERSEAFTEISGIITILREFESMAEMSFKEEIFLSESLTELNSVEFKKIKNNIRLIQSKFLIRNSLFRERIRHLAKRGVVISETLQINIKITMTLNPIDSTARYQQALAATQAVHSELYNIFESKYLNLNNSLISLWLNYFKITVITIFSGNNLLFLALALFLTLTFV